MGTEKYLGLPSMISKSKYNTFRGLKEKVWIMLNNWQNHFLSQTRNEVLIKVVFQAIPTYTMSVFKLPKKLCDDLTKKQTKKINWLKWKKLNLPEIDGCMGFRDIKSFNQAMLVKQDWRFIINHSSLAAQVIKAKYHSQSSLLKFSLGQRTSLIWSRIWDAKSLLAERLI